MDQVRDCKRPHAKGVPIRQIARDLGIARNTVRAYLRGEREVGVYRQESRREQPVGDKIRPMVRKLLDDERLNEVPRKQRLTAARIHRLLEGKEVRASEAVVRRVTREQRLELRDPLERAYLPLAYRPGEDAQVDFFEGEYDDVEHGRTKVFILLVRACYSGRTFAYAAPNQTREALDSFDRTTR